jgi:hypothetical protein
MNLRVLVWLFVFCSAAESGHCQKPVAKKSFSLLVGPTALPKPAEGIGAEAGVLYTIGRWAADAEVAVPIKVAHDDFSRVSETRLGVEVIRYAKRSSWARPFLSLQANYTFRQMTDTNGSTYESKNPRGVFHYGKAFITSPFFSSTLNGGLELPLGKRLFVDLSVGAGVGITTTTYENVEQTFPSDYSNMERRYFSLPPVYKYEGSFAKFHMSGGLRFGYRLYN